MPAQGSVAFQTPLAVPQVLGSRASWERVSHCPPSLAPAPRQWSPHAALGPQPETSPPAREVSTEPPQSSLAGDPGEGPHGGRPAEARSSCGGLSG